MTNSARAPRLPLGAEIALCFLAGAGTFALTGVVVAGVDSDFVILLLAAPYVAAVVAIARLWSIAYAVPVAMAGLLAYDWYYLPPTHPLEVPDTANLVELIVYLAVAVLIGELAAHAARRAESSERAFRAMADGQAALRRVATLVAQAVPERDLLAAVAQEVGTVLNADATRIARYEDEERIVKVAEWSAPGYDAPSFDADEAAGAQVVRAPIVVEGRRWGMMAACSIGEALPLDAGARLTAVTELVATALSNARARAEVRRLADEQAALRRVATLVARQSSAAEVFAAVAEEVGLLLGAENAWMHCYEPDGTATIVARWGELETGHPVGARLTLEGGSVAALVYRTRGPARVDDYAAAAGSLAADLYERGLRSAVGSPIVVDGRLWGAMVAATQKTEPMPPDAESRITEFTELVATAISNIDARSDLAASRARIVATTDQTRRRFERDLHDGAQQRLVSLALELRSAEAIAPPERDDLGAQLSRVREGLTDVLENLRALSQGIHPAILSEGGLGPALKALARRSAVPTRLALNVDGRLEEHVEVAAYYVVSEALTNAAKHARASVAEVRVETRDGVLDLTIGDDGVGGADPGRGSGLIGLRDRVEALGGTLAIASPGGEGTSLHVELPLPVRSSS